MSYTPKPTRSAAQQIEEFVMARYHGAARHEAIEQIRRALWNLATNPRQGTAPPGLFEHFPVYQFILTADAQPQRVSVCYCYDPEDPSESTLLIVKFKAE